MQIYEIRNAVRKKFPRLWKFAKRLKNRLRKFYSIFPIFQIGKLVKAVQFNSKIDLIERDGFLLFCYVGDHFHRVITPDQNKRKSYLDFDKVSKQESGIPEISAQEYLNNWRGPRNADLYLLAHMVNHIKNLAVIDIGCLYGYTTLNYARFLRKLQCGNRVICIDPGFGADLAPYNFKNNGYDNIEFYPYAAGNYNGYLPIFSEPGQNEDNRIVNPKLSDFSVSRIKKAVTIENFLSETKCDSNLFIKMDTQGAEPEVFEGLKNIIKNRILGGVLEFFPSGYRKRMRPEHFLDHLLQQFDIFNIGSGRNRLIKLEKGASLSFVETIYNQKFQWTDLLFISPRVPEKENLINTLVSKR